MYCKLRVLIPSIRSYMVRLIGNIYTSYVYVNAGYLSCVDPVLLNLQKFTNDNHDIGYTHSA